MNDKYTNQEHKVFNVSKSHRGVCKFKLILLGSSTRGLPFLEVKVIETKVIHVWAYKGS